MDIELNNTVMFSIFFIYFFRIITFLEYNLDFQ